jgi:hypothetical protein
MNSNSEEQQKLLLIQENYFADLLELGRFLQNAGQSQKALDLFKQGIEKAETVNKNYLSIILGLLD